jgi:4-hydroxybenzoate polyprenyltransferase
MLSLMRPKQWTKNLLVLAAPLYTDRFLEVDTMVAVGLAFVSLCLVSSATYCANDVLDADRDRLHPRKRLRPVAAGLVAPAHAWVLAVGLVVLGFSLGMAVGSGVAWMLTAYLVIQAAYNLALKQVPIVDVFTVSSGFVLRASLGAVAIQASISGWLLFVTGSLALLLAFSKRRQEFRQAEASGSETRESLRGYNLPSLDALVVFSAAMGALGYGIYAIESRTAALYPSMVLTIPFVMWGVARYLILVFASDQGEEPERVVFGDPQLLLALLGFLVASVLAVRGLSLPFVG